MRCVSQVYIDGLVQERRNSIAITLELRLSCTNPSISGSSVLLSTAVESDIFLAHRIEVNAIAQCMSPRIPPPGTTTTTGRQHYLLQVVAWEIFGCNQK